MAKTEAVVGGVTGLLMVRTVLGSVMPSWKTTRERPRLKGLEMPSFSKDLKRLGQRHVEGMEYPATSGEILRVLCIFTGCTSKRIGRYRLGLLIFPGRGIRVGGNGSGMLTLLSIFPLA